MADGGHNKKRGGGGKKGKVPGKRCAVMFCNNTNADNVSLHQFPRVNDEPRRSKWIAFVVAKRDEDWKPDSGQQSFCSLLLRGTGREVGRVFYKTSIENKSCYYNSSESNA